MLKILITIVVFVVFLFSGCSDKTKLCDKTNIEYIYISNLEKTSCVSEKEDIETFITKYGNLQLSNEILEEQNGGTNKIGTVLYKIMLVDKNDNQIYFEFCEFYNNGVKEFYFQKIVDGLYYITKALTTESWNDMDELFYGDLIIID